MFRLFKTFLVCIIGFFIVPALAWTTLTVSKGETLSGIALKYAPPTITSTDMLHAIYNANPLLSAGLKSGMTLHIPTQAAQVRQALVEKKSNPPAKIATKLKPATLKSAQKTTTVLVAPAKPLATVPPSNSNTIDSALLAKQMANAVATINLLQQTIQTNQAQIADLTQRLNRAESMLDSAQHFFSFSDLWFVLWLITLYLLWHSYKANKKRNTRSSIVLSPHFGDKKQASPEPVAEKNNMAPVTITTPGLKVEPSIGTASNIEDWRQVELDIPASGSPLIQSSIRLEPTFFSLEEQQKLVGEQQNIIDALASDQDNIEWHTAMLEFYIKTNNEGGFIRHMQTMIRSGLLIEGEAVWEKVRKMYLNRWIYKEEI